MNKTVHMRLDIKGALMNWRTSQFKGMFYGEDGHLMTGTEAKEQTIDGIIEGSQLYSVWRLRGI